jgi:pimeloyl-ACP methyl ester carboxylesterase
MGGWACDLSRGKSIPPARVCPRAHRIFPAHNRFVTSICPRLVSRTLSLATLPHREATGVENHAFVQNSIAYSLALAYCLGTTVVKSHMLKLREPVANGIMKVSGIRSPLEFRVFHINGIALHVVFAGPANGKPLIFLHGFPEFWFAWRRQIDHFASSGYRLIIPDQRGYNLSDKPACIASYCIDLLAKDVVSILDNVAGSKAFVVGHDWGAAVTWYLAGRYSERISRAAMLSVPHPRIFTKNLMTNPAQLRRSWYMLFFQLPWLPECILRRRDWALLVRVLQNTSPPGVFSDSDLEQYKESWARKDALTAMLNWYRAALLHPSKLALNCEASRVKVPALLIWGKNDQFLDHAMARESLQYCDDGHLEMLESATHWVQHEQPAQVNNLLSQFFA